MKRTVFVFGIWMALFGMCTSESALADTVQKSIVIGSGVDADGDRRDDNVRLASDNSAAYLLATVASAYSPAIAGTRWIGPSSNAGSSATANATWRFKATFTLPESYTSAKATFSVHADNYATVYLNGSAIGNQVHAETLANFQGAPETFVSSTGFHAGTNEVWLDLYNYSGPTGIDFQVRVDYTATLAELEPSDATAQLVPGEYIVVFKDTVTDVAARAQQLAAAAGGTVLETFDETDGLKGFSVAASSSGLDVLRLGDGVDYLEQDEYVSAQSTTQSGVGWGLDRIDQTTKTLDSSYTYTRTGQGVRVYIVDSGINVSNPEFEGRAFEVYDSVGSSGPDCTGHGTAVAGVVGSKTYGAAKKVRLESVRVLDCSNWTKMSKIAKAVNWITKNGIRPAVVNMSLGHAKKNSVDKAIKKSIAKGFTYVVAAGNESTDACTRTPARVNEAITVGASFLGGSPLYESIWWDSISGQGSNYGSCVDLFAPGVGIMTIGLAGPESETGTSLAAPFVAAAAAMYLQGNPYAAPSQVATILSYWATSGALANTSGSANKLLYTGFFNIPPPPAVFISGPSWSAGGPPVHLTASASPAGSYYFTWYEDRCTISQNVQNCWTNTSGPTLNGNAYDVLAFAEWRYSTVRVEIRATATGPVIASASYFVDGPAI